MQWKAGDIPGSVTALLHSSRNNEIKVRKARQSGSNEATQLAILLFNTVGNNDMN